MVALCCPLTLAVGVIRVITCHNGAARVHTHGHACSAQPGAPRVSPLAALLLHHQLHLGLVSPSHQCRCGRDSSELGSAAMLCEVPWCQGTPHLRTLRTGFEGEFPCFVFSTDVRSFFTPLGIKMITVNHKSFHAYDICALFMVGSLKTFSWKVAHNFLIANVYSGGYHTSEFSPSESLF